MQNIEAINKYLETYGGDGHSIIRAEALVEWGFDFEFVAKHAFNHQSGEHYKEMLFDTKTGKKMDAIYGVYTLDFAYAIAKDVGADMTNARSKMGRGFQAQALYGAIKTAIKEVA